MHRRLLSLAYVLLAVGAFALAKAVQLPAWVGFIAFIALLATGMLVEGYVRDRRHYGPR
jgi:uncharacterized membrane protein YkvI